VLCRGVLSMLSCRLRPPPGDREVLVRPALAEMPALVTRNHDRLDRLDVPILGQPFQSVRAAARQAVAGGADLVVQTGHQPTPFHAGVWIKNFLTNRLARRVAAVPLDVIVDNDAAKHLELRIPRPTPDGRAVVTRVPLTASPPGPDVPYEECPAPTADRLKEIGRVAADACPHDGMREGFEQFWRLVGEVHRPGRSIAELLTDARHRLEVAAGLDNREILMSEMSAGRAFRLLLLHILGDARRFVEVHNAALADYRRAHRIRNRANPMPDLAVEGDLVELPYWVWRRGAGARSGERRGRLTARIGKDTIELRRGDETVLAASRRELLDAETGPALLAEAADRGWKVRPRALTTTMFCRLFVADVFIHGIGGAAYDRVTDRIIREFIGIEPPPYIVCSATVRLPLGAHGASRPSGSRSNCCGTSPITRIGTSTRRRRRRSRSGRLSRASGISSVSRAGRRPPSAAMCS